MAIHAIGSISWLDHPRCGVRRATPARGGLPDAEIVLVKPYEGEYAELKGGSIE